MFGGQEENGQNRTDAAVVTEKASCFAAHKVLVFVLIGRKQIRKPPVIPCCCPVSECSL